MLCLKLCQALELFLLTDMKDKKGYDKSGAKK